MTHGDATHRPLLDEVATDDLIYVEVTQYTDDEYLTELARVLRVIGQNATTGVDLEEWFDRENHIREMRDMAFPTTTTGVN